MPKICYIEKRFSKATQAIIDNANRIIAGYQNKGYRLTLRQLYYVFVTENLLTNTTESYNRLGGIINDGRLAGEIDWDAIEDRTRGLDSPSHWEDPSDIISACVHSFAIDKWEGQKYRPYCYIEKEALAGVFAGPCKDLDIAFLSCRGYTSQSEMWRNGIRLQKDIQNDQTPIIFHFGDHDPSGIDMTRDIHDRLSMFVGEDVDVRRIALNIEQIEERNLPPNPAKMSDSRATSYVARFGDKSWELDALPPDELDRLLREAVQKIRDDETYEDRQNLEKRGKKLLEQTSSRWEEVIDHLS